MSEPQMQVEVEEREPTPEELELMAAKQLLIELHMIKRRIQTSGTILNGVLVVQVKFLLNGLIKKYNNSGLLLGEKVELKLAQGGKSRSTSEMWYKYTPKLQNLVNEVVAAEIKSQEERAEREAAEALAATPEPAQ